jgi:hypothetical protein
VSFDSSHLGGVTTVVYELQQGDEADGGDPVSPEMVRAYQDKYQHEYQDECANWKLNSQRLAPVAVQVLKVVSEGWRGEGVVPNCANFICPGSCGLHSAMRRLLGWSGR